MKVEYKNLVSVVGNDSDITIIAVLDKLAIAKEKAQTLFSEACGKMVVIDDWEDGTSYMHVNYPSLEYLEDCDLLEDLEEHGYAISID